MKNQLEWLALRGEDIQAAVNRSVQTKAASFNPIHIKMIIKTVAQACKFADLVLSLPPLDRSALHIGEYSVTSFATKEDGASKVRFIILLVYGAGKACLVSFARRKYKSVVLSVLGAEVFAFTHAVYYTLMLRNDLWTLLRCDLRVRALTSSSSLFPIVIR